jgi:hypothetical protein
MFLIFFDGSTVCSHLSHLHRILRYEKTEIQSECFLSNEALYRCRVASALNHVMREIAVIHKNAQINRRILFGDFYL